MNFIASVFVYHASDSLTSIKLMDIFFNKKNYRSIYTNNLAGCKYHANKIVKVLDQKCSDLYAFFKFYEINLIIFI